MCLASYDDKLLCHNIVKVCSANNSLVARDFHSHFDNIMMPFIINKRRLKKVTVVSELNFMLSSAGVKKWSKINQSKMHS